MDAFDDDGNSVGTGEGDLVITKPLPFMPLGFLGDDQNDTRLKDAYFNRYPNKLVWYHGDHSKHESRFLTTQLILGHATVAIDQNGGITMLGRSDGVLNPQGVRFGSAELYAIVEEMKDE